MKLSKTATGGCCCSTSADDVDVDGGAIRRATRSNVANSSGSGPRSVTSACTRPVSSAMLRARTTSVSPSSCSDPDDDLRRADQLPDPNHRRVGQDGGRRHLQPLERLLPLRRA